MNLYLDIETVPGQHPGAIEAVRATLKPPGTLKKAESIAAWWANEAEAAAEEAHRKQSLDGGTQGEIISIACVNEDGAEWVKCRAVGESEAELLRQFFEAVDQWCAEEASKMTLGHPDAWPVDAHFPVAHNAAFDLGFIWRRAIVLRVPLPRWIPGPSARAGRDYGCSMVEWAGFGGRVSLDSLCRALGITSPKDDGMDGSKVYDAWKAGKVDQIAAYNRLDAHAVAEVWERLVGRGRTAARGLH